MFWKKFRASIWLEIAALTIISALVYLIPIKGLSYYRDDWYYMYDGLVGGSKIFVEMFRHLRPARCIMVIPNPMGPSTKRHFFYGVALSALSWLFMVGTGI